MEKKVERIQVDKKNRSHKVKVNQDFVTELVEQSKKSKSTKHAADVEKLMTDDRFKSMFEDTEFKRDKQSSDYKHVTPVSHFHCFNHGLHLLLV